MCAQAAIRLPVHTLTDIRIADLITRKVFVVHARFHFYFLLKRIKIKSFLELRVKKHNDLTLS